MLKCRLGPNTATDTEVSLDCYRNLDQCSVCIARDVREDIAVVPLLALAPAVPGLVSHRPSPSTSSDFPGSPSTYDHRYWRIRDPVRSPIDKPVTDRLVLGWVTTGESLLLYVPLHDSVGPIAQLVRASY
ncbi:hypothetical protein GE09DRAFT_28071 [Coniochaeta sp. 2T2.1]|nr:hypothetical protein GE09DRAFT_28071 [Coniochaeta sp. 2T2.1]